MPSLPTVPASAAHRVALLADLPADTLLVHEIYRSVQGESTFAGLPCGFVRTTGCDLRCGWCDTPHAFAQGERLTRREVFDRALALDTPLVEITGGEPLLQPAVYPLMAALCDAGKTVLLETSGAHPTDDVDPRVRVILDVKCPASGEADRNHWPNLDRLRPTDEVKFVIADRGDWAFAERVIRRHRLDARAAVLVSGVFGAVPPRELVGWLLASRLNARFQVQLHKVVWEPTARGV
jgi:7-carboxy-7-deazaguanine synthase